MGAALALAQTDQVPPGTLALACDPANVEVLLAGSAAVLGAAVVHQLDAAPSC